LELLRLVFQVQKQEYLLKLLLLAVAVLDIMAVAVLVRFYILAMN
jgi:hypothetical protein